MNSEQGQKVAQVDQKSATQVEAQPEEPVKAEGFPSGMGHDE
jgi:hypothetical protein